MKEIYLKNALEGISSINDEEKLRFSLYGCYVSLLLSKDLFFRNREIEVFLRNININLKDYVFGSRTNIVSKVTREIEKANKEELIIFREAAIKLVFVKRNKDLSKTDKNKSGNYIDSILKQFGD